MSETGGMRMLTVRLMLVAMGALAVACSGSDSSDAALDSGTPTGEAVASSTDETAAPPADEAVTPDNNDRVPVVLDAAFDQNDDGTFDVAVTLSSLYDSPSRYADAWRVSTLDGEVLGVRELLHDHANEQPFTRSLRGVTIPDGVTVVLIDGRDSVNGWGRPVEFQLS